MSNREGRCRLASAGLALSSLLVATGALIGTTTASADAPVRAGWWTAASAQGIAAPAPTAPAGGMRVESAAGQTTAFGAVLFNTKAPGGTLALQVASSTGTPVLQACPAANDSWDAGEDQPQSAAPGYDCTAAKFLGTVSKDGATVTFLVTTFGQNVSGQLDLVLLPAADPSAAVPPTFSIDFSKPGSASFTPAATSFPSEPVTVQNPTVVNQPVVAATPVLGAMERTSDTARLSAPASPPVVAPSANGASDPQLSPVARRNDAAPNKPGLALAALLLSLAAWIRFLPAERS